MHGSRRFRFGKKNSCFLTSMVRVWTQSALPCLRHRDRQDNRRCIRLEIMPTVGNQLRAPPLLGGSEPILWHGGDQMSQQEAADLVHYLEDRTKEGYTLLTWNGLGFDLAQVTLLNWKNRRFCRSTLRKSFGIGLYLAKVDVVEIPCDASLPNPARKTIL